MRDAGRLQIAAARVDKRTGSCAVVGHLACMRRLLPPSCAWPARPGHNRPGPAISSRARPALPRCIARQTGLAGASRRARCKPCWAWTWSLPGADCKRSALCGSEAVWACAALGQDCAPGMTQHQAQIMIPREPQVQRAVQQVLTGGRSLPSLPLLLQPSRRRPVPPWSG